jgi:predicted dehydrogenase
MACKKTFRWGIIGCGGISSHFAAGLKSLDNARITAVASREASRAAEFAKQYGANKSYGSYEQLARDPDIDIVYVGTIHPAHMDNTLLCIENGKHVLCEKPFAINTQQAQRMIDAAKDANVFLMEAMWTRFIPSIQQVQKWLNDSTIGQVSHLSAHFGFKAARKDKPRLFELELGGGALLDVGIYPISLASMVFGCQPSNIATMVEMGSTGVDEKAAIIMDHGKKRFANLACSINTGMSNEAIISGTKGSIRLCKPFWHPEKIVLQIGSDEPQTFDFPFAPGLNGYSYEAMAVMNDIANGKTENSSMPLKESIEIMTTLDAIRKQWQLKYPCE